MRMPWLGAVDLMSSGSNSNPFEKFALRSCEVAMLSETPRKYSTLCLNGESHATKKRRRDGTHDAAPDPKGLVEKYRSPGQLEWPLRLIIVGHNPSETAWKVGHYYANPSNRMYKLLGIAGIIPSDFTAANDDDCPITCGVGFTDVGFSHPGTISSEFKKQELHAWRQGFYDRLKAHARRAADTVTNETSNAGSLMAENMPANCRAGQEGNVDSIEEGYPLVIAFAGKRQFEELFFDASASMKAATRGGNRGQFRFGQQPSALRPPGWPFPPQSTDVFVIPSSSGAAAMSNETREAPYVALGHHLSTLPKWTRSRSSKQER